MRENEYLDLEIEPKILREFIKKHKGETTFTHTDIYESLEIFKKEAKQRINLAIQKLLEDVELKCRPYDFIEVGNKKLEFEEIAEIIKKQFPNNTSTYNDEISKETAKRIIELIEFESETSIGHFDGIEWTPNEKLEKQNKETCNEIIKNIKQKFKIR